MLAHAHSTKRADARPHKVFLDEQILDEFLRHHPTLPSEPGRIAEELRRHGMLRAKRRGPRRSIALGEYRLIQRLNRRSRVYLAEHAGLGRVLLRVLPATRARDVKFLDRFYREVRRASAIDHPNLVRVWGTQKVGSVHFLVQEFVEGSALDHLLCAGQPLSYSLAAHYIAQAADGLDHARHHGQSDMSCEPSSFLIDGAGQVKIANLGLDRICRGETMSSNDTDSSDVIRRLGHLLYALVRGQQATIAREPLHVAQPEVPREFSMIVHRMMGDERGRMRSLAEVVSCLKPFAPLATPTLDDICLSDTLILERLPCPPAAVEPGPSTLGRFMLMVAGALGIAAALLLLWHGGATMPWVP